MMRKDIRHDRTMDYYDGILLFEARDYIGGHYIASILETGKDSDRYLLTGCEPGELRLLRSGGTDLRSLLERSARHGWCIAELTKLDEPLKVGPAKEGPITEDLLPKPGMLIAEAEVDHRVVATARERDNVVIQVAVETIEDAGNLKIDARTLSNLITYVQSLTRQAVIHPTPQKLGGRTLERLPKEAHQLDVIDLSPGSTRVTFQGVHRTPFGNQLPLSRAMEELDEVLRHSGDPDATKETLLGRDPRIASAYLNLLKFLRTKKTSLSCTWATPQSTRPHHRNIPLADTYKLVEILDCPLDVPVEPQRGRRMIRMGWRGETMSEEAAMLEGRGETMPEETVMLEGTLEMVDRTHGRWRILDLEGRPAEGTMNPDGIPISLLTIGARYTLVCMETLTQGTSGAKRATHLHLQQIDPIV